MAKQNPFQQIKLVYRRSSLALKILVLVTILVSAAALIALRVRLVGYQERSQVLQSQAAQLQQKNEALEEDIAKLGSKDSIREIAKEQLGLMDPESKFFSPGK